MNNSRKRILEYMGVENPFDNSISFEFYKSNGDIFVKEVRGKALRELGNLTDFLSDNNKVLGLANTLVDADLLPEAILNSPIHTLKADVYFAVQDYFKANQAPADLVLKNGNLVAVNPD